MAQGKAQDLRIETVAEVNTSRAYAGCGPLAHQPAPLFQFFSLIVLSTIFFSSSRLTPRMRKPPNFECKNLPNLLALRTELSWFHARMCFSLTQAQAGDGTCVQAAK
jgi:hypothetical protein